MKLGIITDEISQDFAYALGVAREIGSSGVELRTMWESGVHELSPGRIREIGSLLEQHALECYDIAGPVFKCDIGSQREIGRHFDILKRCCEVAYELGCPNVRSFTFWREPSVPIDSVWSKIVELIARAAEIAAEAELTLAVENEYSVYVAGGVMLARLLDQVEPDNVGAIWDPQNALFDPDAEAPYPDGFEAVADRIALCHIKDGVATPDGPKSLPVGEGKAMLAELVGRLKRDGYAGYLSLETHWRPGQDLDEETVRMPRGQAFSGGSAEVAGGSAEVAGGSAEVASRICMANLRRLIEEA